MSVGWLKQRLRYLPFLSLLLNFLYDRNQQWIFLQNWLVVTAKDMSSIGIMLTDFPWVLTTLVLFNGICDMYKIWTLLCDNWSPRQIFCLFVFQGTSVLSPGLHIGLLIVLAVMIYKKSTTQLFEKHSCLYVLTFGFVNAKISQKLVVRNLVSVLNLLKLNWFLA